VIREEIERLLENITTLAEAASLATSTALTDELVSHGELMSTLLFVEILRERNVQAQWFDVRKVMRTNDRFGRAEPDVTALAELATLQLAPRLSEGLVITQGFIGSEGKGRTTTLGRGGSDYTAAYWQKPCTQRALISGPTFPAFTRPIRAWFRLRSVLMKLPLKRPRKWRPLARKFCTRQPCCQPYVAIFRYLWAPVKIQKQAVRWYVIKPRIHRCSGRWHYAVSRRC
jgi:hypothetical protein